MHLPEDSYGLGFRVYSAALEGSISNYDRKLSAVGSMLGTEELGYSETPSAARPLIGTKALGLCGR